MPTPNKIWNPMCECNHRGKLHKVNTRKNGTSDPICTVKNCGCSVFYPKHDPARASDWVTKK